MVVPSRPRACVCTSRANTHNGTDDGTNTECAGRGVMPHGEQAQGQPETEEVNAYKADDSGKLIVIILARDFRLPEVLRHIEAGRILLVIL